jgi:uncharacterized protein (UPF0371 family)
MNFDKLKQLINQSKDLVMDSDDGDHKTRLLALSLERLGLNITLYLRVRENGVQADIDISCDDDVLVETADAFSKNDSDIESSIFQWLEEQVSYALAEQY